MSQSGRLESPTPSRTGSYRLLRRRHRTRGQSMVEFTLILPVLMLMIFGIYQFGQTYSDYIQVTNAARTGGRKALVSRSDANGVTDAIAAAKGATWWLNTSQDERDRVAGAALDHRADRDGHRHLPVQHQPARIRRRLGHAQVGHDRPRRVRASTPSR